MATFTKLKLSGSTDGKAIKVVQTATAGTTIHTAHATALDEIWLYAHNSSNAAVKLTLEFGGVAAPDDHIEINIGAEGTGLVLVSPGLLLTNSLVVKAFAGTANVITLTGYVNRIA
jgi:hypothetical protein